MKGLHVSKTLELEAAVAQSCRVPRMAQSRVSPCNARGVRLWDVCARLDATLDGADEPGRATVHSREMQTFNQAVARDQLVTVTNRVVLTPTRDTLFGSTLG